MIKDEKDLFLSMNRFIPWKPIAENIWIVDGDLIEMDVVLTKLPLVS